MEISTNFKELEIGFIPKDWDAKKMREIADFQYGLGEAAQEKGDYVYIRITDITSDGFLKRDKLVFIDQAKVKEDCFLEKGDVLVARTGASFGKTYFFNENFKATYGGFLIKYLFNNKFINNKFFFQFSRSNLYWNQANNLVNGGAQPQFNANVIKNLIVPLPSLAEQSSIVEILSSLDDKIELNRKINNNLEKIASLLFKQWFVDFEFPNENGEPYKSSDGKMIDSELGEIPKGWKISKIGNELNTILGGTPRRNNDDYWGDGNIPWINSGAINNFPIIESSEFITKKGLDNSATKLMPVKTVVLPFVISLGKEIKISILGIETSGNQSVLGVIENERFSAEYIYYWIEKNKNSIYGWATGGAQQHINKQNVDETSILIPLKDIMDKFRIITVPIFDNIISNSILNKQVEKLRNSLLPRLMNGKIRVNKKYEQ
jgi:type I restriction enzyme S subunit